jgi:IS30 family transposase
MWMSGPPRLPRERVRQMWRARLAGATLEEAAAEIGVSKATVERWIAESGGMIPTILIG